MPAALPDAMFMDPPARTEALRGARADFEAIGRTAGRSALRPEEDSER